MKVDNEIITSHDIEQEINYLKALNPGLKQINKENLHINPNVNNKHNIINTAEICRVGKDLF